MPRRHRLIGRRRLHPAGFGLRSSTATREFLERFHDKDLEKLRPAREDQKSFIFPSGGPVAALQEVQAGCVRGIAKLYEQQGQRQTIATIDQDATIIESHKQAALYHYEGRRGYQPMVAVWAELDLAVADGFRDGNVPAKQAPLTCAKVAFAALPENIRQRYFRGDSACHENELLDWLKHPDRAKEPGGRIGFAVSAGDEPDAGRSHPEGQGAAMEGLRHRGRRNLEAVGGSGFCSGGRLRIQGQPAAALCGTEVAQAPRHSLCRRVRPAPPRGDHQPDGEDGRGTVIAVAPGEGRDGGAHPR